LGDNLSLIRVKLVSGPDDRAGYNFTKSSFRETYKRKAPNGYVYAAMPPEYKQATKADKTTYT
jgi:hypothetical protein